MAFLVMEIACAKAVRRDCAWCVRSSASGLEWGRGGGEQVGEASREQIVQDSWSVIKSEDFREKWALQGKEKENKE